MSDPREAGQPTPYDLGWREGKRVALEGLRAYVAALRAASDHEREVKCQAMREIADEIEARFLGETPACPLPIVVSDQVPEGQAWLVSDEDMKKAIKEADEARAHVRRAQWGDDVIWVNRLIDLGFLALVVWTTWNGHWWFAGATAAAWVACEALGRWRGRGI